APTRCPPQPAPPAGVRLTAWLGVSTLDAAVLARNLVSDSAPANCQVIPDLHANTNSTELAIGDPRHVVDISDLFDDQVIFIRKLSTVVEVANVITPSEAFPRPSGRDPRPPIFARVHPPRV